MLINKRESVGSKHCNDLKAFIDYSNDMADVYGNIKDYNPVKKRKMLIEFNDLVAHMLSNETIQPIFTDIFISGSELIIFIVFIVQFCFFILKNIRFNTTHYFIIKISNK